VELQERQHLEEAKERGAVVMDFGDLFDVMGGKFDPRKTESGIKARHKVDHYFDAVLDDAVDFYSPYADNMVLFGLGNHETSVLKHHQLNLTHGLSRGLKRAATRQDIANVGGYGGYVLLTFVIQKTVKHTISLKYHHGAGGSSPVTGGTMRAQRWAAKYPDADICVSGHIHKSWTRVIEQETINRHGRISKRNQLHISLAGYKDEWDDGAAGWAVERDMEPNTTGACWLHLQYQSYKANGIANGKAPIKVMPTEDTQ
jgi:hypothetical protein